MAEGKYIEVRALIDESITRQVFLCRDRVGQVRRIAAYTDDKTIPNLEPGRVLKWVNPRFYWFLDGGSGGRSHRAGRLGERLGW